MHSCREANERLKIRTAPVARGEAIHPASVKTDMNSGVAAAKAMYQRFYKKAP